MVYTLLFFPLQNAVCFIILKYLVTVLFTFYIQGVLKLKKNNSGAKRIMYLKTVNEFLPDFPFFIDRFWRNSVEHVHINCFEHL